MELKVLFLIATMLIVAATVVGSNPTPPAGELPLADPSKELPKPVDDSEDDEVEPTTAVPSEADKAADLLDLSRLHDPEHYYRAPGNLCNSSEYIDERLAELDERDSTTNETTKLQRQHLERSKCLWYTFTYCAKVEDKLHTGKEEFRCICNEGRTWESGACLAYDQQECLWNTDCVHNAKCIFKRPRTNRKLLHKKKQNEEPGMEETVKPKRRKRQAGEEEDTQFAHGTCFCDPMEKCQRSAVHPPFYDSSRGVRAQFFGVEATLGSLLVCLFRL